MEARLDDNRNTDDVGLKIYEDITSVIDTEFGVFSDMAVRLCLYDKTDLIYHLIREEDFDPTDDDGADKLNDCRNEFHEGLIYQYPNYLIRLIEKNYISCEDLNLSNLTYRNNPSSVKAFLEHEEVDVSQIKVKFNSSNECYNSEEVSDIVEKVLIDKFDAKQLYDALVRVNHRFTKSLAIKLQQSMEQDEDKACMYVELAYICMVDSGKECDKNTVYALRPAFPMNYFWIDSFINNACTKNNYSSEEFGKEVLTRKFLPFDLDDMNDAKATYINKHRYGPGTGILTKGA